MAILRVANVHFTSTGNNRLEYLGGAITRITSTGALRLPLGTDAERPTGENGLIRYNSTTNRFEGYASGAWGLIGGGSSFTSNVIITVSDSTNAALRIVQSGSRDALQVIGTVNVSSLGVGTNASGIFGEIRAANNITAYFSDRRLKDIISLIPDPLEKVKSLSGIVYVNNDLAGTYGYKNKNEQIGVIAQEVEAVLPQIVKLAPFDTEFSEGFEKSISGNNYKTVQYDKLIPLLIEAIKELAKEVEELKKNR